MPITDLTTCFPKSLFNRCLFQQGKKWEVRHRRISDETDLEKWCIYRENNSLYIKDSTLKARISHPGCHRLYQPTNRLTELLYTYYVHLSHIFCQSFLLHLWQHTHNGLCQRHECSSAEGCDLHPIFPFPFPWSRCGHLSSRSLLAEEYPAPHTPRTHSSLESQ